jgi:hypothetical protein
MEKSCPKQEQLRTGLKENAKMLSEAGLTSDRFKEKCRKAVQSWGDFGQV